MSIAVACDVMKAMLDGKNNNLSLRWELNFIIVQILRNKNWIVLRTNQAVDLVYKEDQSRSRWQNNNFPFLCVMLRKSDLPSQQQQKQQQSLLVKATGFSPVIFLARF